MNRMLICEDNHPPSDLSFNSVNWCDCKCVQCPEMDTFSASCEGDKQKEASSTATWVQEGSWRKLKHCCTRKPAVRPLHATVSSSSHVHRMKRLLRGSVCLHVKHECLALCGHHMREREWERESEWRWSRWSRASKVRDGGERSDGI